MSNVDNTTEMFYTTSDLDVIYDLPYIPHPSYDCFVMKKIPSNKSTIRVTVESSSRLAGGCCASPIRIEYLLHSV